MFKEFGWSPDVIDELTFDQLWFYTQSLQQYRQIVPPVDVTLEKIKSVIFSYFDIKEDAKVTNDPIDKLSNSGFKSIGIKKEELQAYYKAGMPSPPEKWLKEYRKRKNGNG